MATDNMTPVPQSLLVKTFEKPLEAFIEGLNLDGRATPAEFLRKVDEGYTRRTLAAFVDDLADPHFFLVLGTVNTLVLDAPTCIIYMIYGDQPGENRKKLRDEALLTAEAYAKNTKCGDLAVSTITYLGAKDLGGLWEGLEFEEQERIFTKMLP